ncbi:peptidylprolyl isomerase [Winogradskyella sp. A3E31]|uniref:peptidylprolyl isomerase n=1 Tax=Winogradskyella sp. A3E31 TaxID=3349637 RepID=UPI00398A919A
MKLKYALLFLSVLQLSYAQKEDKVLLTVGDEFIKVSEFLRVYNKNLDLVKDENQKDLENYLDLFINYKLKLAEAKRLRLDTVPKYQREFGNYKNQLVKNYISENKVTDALVEEAYDRMKYDVKAVHVLIKDNPDAQDTLKAYNQILKYRDQLITEGFDATKKALHDGASVFVEDLGYFSTFKMVYDFETAAYNTKVGEVSQPFTTQFGYHVVKVLDKRPSRGTVTVGHIMISNKQTDSTIIPKERAELIYNKYTSGESFDALAKQFSDDKSSARNGGKLAPFKSGQLSSPEFEDAAFALENSGDVSKPIKTQYGYHIIKLIEKKPIPSFEEVRSNLVSQVQRDSRSKLINSAMVDELRSRYSIEEDKNAKPYFKTIITQDYFMGKLELPQNFNADKSLININGETTAYKDFISHLKSAQRRYYNKPISINTLIENEYKVFIENTILDYRKEHLEEEDEEFAEILKEYRDGLLLFDLMEKEIWNKAAKDTTGLKDYYDTNKSNYISKESVAIFMASTPDKAQATAVRGLLKSGKTEEEIKTIISKDGKIEVVFTKGVFEKSDEKFPSDFKFEQGVSEVLNHNESFHVIKVNETIPQKVRPFEEIKGAVINDYQNHLEKQWLETLRNRYTVNVNKKVFESLK